MGQGRSPKLRAEILGRPGRFSALLKAGIPLPLAGFVPYLSCEGTSSEERMSQCLHTFREKTQRYRDQLKDFHCSVAAAPRLKPIRSEETVLRALYQYSRQHDPLSPGTAPRTQPPTPHPPAQGQGLAGPGGYHRELRIQRCPKPQAAVNMERPRFFLK